MALIYQCDRCLGMEQATTVLKSLPASWVTLTVTAFAGRQYGATLCGRCDTDLHTFLLNTPGDTP